MSMSNGTPDIGSLLIDEHLEGADVQTISEAAANALEPVLCGIESIGYLLWHLASSKDDVHDIDEDHLSDLGWLVQTLARQAHHFQRIESNARGILHESELAKLDASRPAPPIDEVLSRTPRKSRNKKAAAVRAATA